MDTRKVLGIIFSILFVGAFTFVLCWGIINFNKVKDILKEKYRLKIAQEEPYLELEEI